MTSFSNSPRWYRPVLCGELELLRLFRNRLPTTAHLHGDDDDIAGYVFNADLGVRAAERMVPGANASPYLIEHVARYLWAMDLVRGRTVADLGCGEGYGTFLLSWCCAAAVGVDMDAEAVAHAKATYAGPDYRIGDLTDSSTLPAADVAVCFEVLEHIGAPEQLLRAVGEHYARLLLSFPNPLVGGSHINPHHCNDWPLSHLKAVLRRAGAKRIVGHHQHVRHYRVSRGALPFHGTWLLDVRW